MSEYNLADAHGQSQAVSEPESAFVRSKAFVSGKSSHTKVAVPDAIESKTLKVSAPPAEPGVRVVVPPRKRVKVATLFKNLRPGDFSRAIQVSGESAESRHMIGLKLYGSAMDPVRFRAGRR